MLSFFILTILLAVIVSPAAGAVSGLCWCWMARGGELSKEGEKWVLVAICLLPYLALELQ